MRADRLISLLLLLQTRGQMTAQDLAKRLEVSTRTIYRDLDALSGAGVPVYAERGPQGGCALMESYRTNLTGLKEDEVQALFMLTVPGLLAELGADRASEAALLKVTAALPKPFQQTAAQVRRRIYLDAAAWFQPPEKTPHLSTVQDALWQQRRLRITYRRADGTWIKQLVDPYGLVAKAGIWYMVAYVHRRRLQSYRIARIEKSAITDSHFDLPDDFDLATFWSEWVQSFEQSLEKYSVTLRVWPQGIQPLVELFGDHVHRLIANAETNHDEGFSTLEFFFQSEEAACRQLMGLGTAIEIVRPAELRLAIVHRARKLLLHHDLTGVAISDQKKQSE